MKISATERIKIETEFTPEEANAFCRFCSRSTFDTFLEHATGHYDENQKIREAYEMRDAVYKIWHLLTN